MAQHKRHNTPVVTRPEDIVAALKKLGTKVEKRKGFYVISELPSTPHQIEWSRVGGHRFGFFALDAEVENWLCNELPAAHAPYSIIVTGQLREHPVKKLCKLREQGHSQFYLRSHQLTPDLRAARKPFEPENKDRVDAQLGYAGLILLQQFHPDENYLTMVDKVRHWPTDTVHFHQEYLPLFNIMKRKIRTLLVHWGTQKNRRGAIEQWTRPMFTEGVATAIRNGILKNGLRIGKR